MSDCKYKSEITCPFCETEKGDSWECGDSGDEVCDDCGKEFHFERDVEVTYSSSCSDNSHNYQHQPSEKFPDYYECANCEEVQFKDKVVESLNLWKSNLGKSETDSKKEYCKKLIKMYATILNQLT